MPTANDTTRRAAGERTLHETRAASKLRSQSREVCPGSTQREGGHSAHAEILLAKPPPLASLGRLLTAAMDSLKAPASFGLPR